MDKNLNKSILQIDLPPDFNWQTNLSYLTCGREDCLYDIKDGKVYRVLNHHSGNTLVEIYPSQSHLLNVNFLAGDAPTSDDKQILKDYIVDWFDLETHMDDFYALGKENPLLKEPIAKYRGLHLIGIPDLFEAISWAIIGQLINLSMAYRVKRQWVESFGESLEYQGQTYWVHPKPEAIASLKVEDLKNLQTTRRKKEYLIEVAAFLAEGRLDKKGLIDIGDLNEAERILTRIRGIGSWTAHYVLMRCLRYSDAIPLADAELIKAIKHQAALQEKPTREQILSLTERFRPFRAYACFYLWRTVY